MYVPCNTCRDKSRCYRFTSMNREAFFAAAAGDVVDCPEHKEQVEGARDYSIDLDFGGSRRTRRDNRFFSVWSPAFVGTR